MTLKPTGKIWTTSNGIANDANIAKFFQSSAFVKINRRSKPHNEDKVVGWGHKTNTKNACHFAERYGLDYMRLEDGFISYLGHPADKSPRFSLIQDDRGIYYDARKASDLEHLCVTVDDWYNAEFERRACELTALLTLHGISKYNHQRNVLPDWLANQEANSIILVVDQTVGDVSVVQGGGSSACFKQMITEALASHPDKMIVVKTHPDVIKGTKQGFINRDACQHPRVKLLSDDCAIKALMAKVERVYTVTSQLGFEALLYGLPVHCYGMPFYAGWGLTLDKKACDRRNISLTLPQLVAAALIVYPKYLDPETSLACEVEVVVAWLMLQLEEPDHVVDVCYAFNFSLWKRAFIKPFIGRMAKRVVYIKSCTRLERLIKSEPKAAVLLWGKSQAKWAETLQQDCPVWFMEDGFVRSVGLGADLRRPSCLVIDRQGMYYAPDGPSDIVDLLNRVTLNNAQARRAELLTNTLVERALSKYNVGQKSSNNPVLADILSLRSGDKHGLHRHTEIILVPGQFEQDQSIASSRGKVKSNLQLLQQVRQDYPDAYIIYKEHPDLYSGVRPGALGESAARHYANIYLADVDIVSVLALCDRVCTITSLTGFEALLRGKTVTTYGSPFYAGWGLTDDVLEFTARKNQLSLHQLVYATLISYSRYVDWSTGLLTSPERVIQILCDERAEFERKGLSGQQLSSAWWSRLNRKIRYFYQAYRL